MASSILLVVSRLPFRHPQNRIELNSTGSSAISLSPAWFDAVIAASKDFYDRKAHDLRTQTLELLGRMNEMRVSAPAPVQDAIDLMDLTSGAAELFVLQAVPEKQRFLKLVLKAASWQNGRLCTEFENPFESLRRSNRVSRTKQAADGTPTGEIEGL